MDSLRKSIRFSLPVIWLYACASAPTMGGGPTPYPQPRIPTTTSPVATPMAGSWSFAYSPGIVAYQVSRNATITNTGDSAARHEISGNLTRETFVLEPGDSIVRVVATIDSFVTTTQGSIGPAQAVQIPVQLSAEVSAGGLIIDDTVSTIGCNPVRSVLKADLNHLLITLPAQVSSGMTWRDSVSINGCQGGLPGASEIIRNFKVGGQIDFEDRPMILVERQDSLVAHGQGAQQQHQISFDAHGTGRATYLVDFRAGRIFRVITEQSLAIAIISSGRVSNFTQRSQQEFRLLP